MPRFSLRFAFLLGFALAAALLDHSSASADEPGGNAGAGHGSSVYQRKGSDSSWNKNGHRWGHKRNNFRSPEVSSGWFQRPYPYHLDYYKMRYHGSYAPYFGNLYGTPQVVTAPPYYGPYYDRYIAPGANGFEMSEGIEGPVFEGGAPSGMPGTIVPGSETLPAP